MIDLVLRKVFGSKHERDIKRMRPQVAAINELEAEIGSWPDEAFRRRADELRQKLHDYHAKLTQDVLKDAAL